MIWVQNALLVYTPQYMLHLLADISQHRSVTEKRCSNETKLLLNSFKYAPTVNDVNQMNKPRWKYSGSVKC